MGRFVIDIAIRFRVLMTRALIRLGFREESFLVLMAVCVGVATAGAAVLFHQLIVLLRTHLFSAAGAHYLYGPGLYLLVMIPTLGGLLTGILAKLVFKVKSIHGLVDVMESVIRTKGFTSPVVAVEKILTSGITIGTGGSVGAEAPIVQIGAAISSGFGRLFGLSRHSMPLIVSCGSAAGISAIFNSPIGGVLFTLEVILQDFSLRTFAPVVVASVIANVTTQALLAWMGHEYPAIFELNPSIVREQLQSGWRQMPSFLMLGIAAGLMAVLFTRLMIRLEHAFGRLKMPPFAKPALGGLIVGLLGVGYVLFFGRYLLGQAKPIDFSTYPLPAFFSDGYGAMQPMLAPDFYLGWGAGPLVVFLIGLLALKTIATCVTVSSGGGGGIIAPSLFMGAVLGGVLGYGFKLAGFAAQPDVFALVGMGAVLAAVVHAPMAAILILLELTHDYKLTLPAMLAVVTAVSVAKMLFRDSLYTTVLRQRGIHVGDNADLVLLRRMTVEQVPLDPTATLHGTETIAAVLERMEESGTSDFVVIDENSKYVGMVVAEDLLAAMRHHEASPLLIVQDLVRKDVPVVKTTDDLASVLDKFATFEVDHLPVMTEHAPDLVIGMLSRRGLIRRYREGIRDE